MEDSTHTGTETWIHLDSLDSVEKSDESRDDTESWVSFKSEDEREFEEPEMYETKSYCASGQASGRLDCGRNNSKWPMISYNRYFSIFLTENILNILVFRNIDTKKGW